MDQNLIDILKSSDHESCSEDIEYAVVDALSEGLIDLAADSIYRLLIIEQYSVIYYVSIMASEKNLRRLLRALINIHG